MSVQSLTWYPSTHTAKCGPSATIVYQSVFSASYSDLIQNVRGVGYRYGSRAAVYAALNTWLKAGETRIDVGLTGLDQPQRIGPALGACGGEQRDIHFTQRQRPESIGWTQAPFPFEAIDRRAARRSRGRCRCRP